MAAEENMDIVTQCVEELTTKKGRLPTFKQLAEATGFPEEECKEFMIEYRQMVKEKQKKQKVAPKEKAASAAPSEPEPPVALGDGKSDVEVEQEQEIPPAQATIDLDAEEALRDGQGTQLDGQNSQPQVPMTVESISPEKPDNQLGLPDESQELKDLVLVPAEVTPITAKRKLFDAGSNANKSPRFAEA